ncbi:MAG: TonB-dependent receptor [Pseudohongiella sp.]|uniref:TonB-dependent receptor plug domain-containing protein n=1 Tax=Pseudohongiella sp. TaxID=1979412 RepID=UPI0034A0865B
MKSHTCLSTSIRRILAIGVTAAAGSAVHAQAPAPTIEEVVVTGSLIRGMAEDGAIPVDRISIEDLEQRGSPPPLEMLKSLSYMAGIVGESNPFTSGRGQASEGTASINLRGFGPERTLVLLNGKRLPVDDANRLPTNAIARVEVLKDGGSVTYGSDAIGGVVNYITKTSTDGLELTGDYRGISDSDGDYNLGLAWGGEVGGGDLLLTANYYHRSPLLTRDRDWAIQPYAVNPEGGWTTGSNPGSFRTTFVAPLFADPACEEFGGVLTNQSGVPSVGGDQCRMQFTGWDQLVDKQDTVQLYSQYNYSFDNGADLHVEALYAETDTPYTNITPSFTTARNISSTVNPNGVAQSSAFRDPAAGPIFTIPATNPGYQLFKQQNPALAVASPGNAYITINQWRPFLAGGNPMFGYKESHQSRKRDSMRLSAELTGDLTPTLGYTTSLTYGNSSTVRQEYDISTGKLQLAMRGLGGEGCNTGLGTAAFEEGTPGAGACQWFNPFSNAVPGNPLTGFVNPNFDASVENSAELVAWMTDRHWAETKGEVSEFNFVLDGELPLQLGAGAASFATGVQYRYTTSEQNYNEFANALLSPCLDTPINGDVSCEPQGESPYNFLATYEPTKLARGVYAVFGEIYLPVTDSLTAQVAARFEDYGDKGGNSFDPNLRLRWQATDMVALRASLGTTFRAPPQASLLTRETTGFSSVLGSNRPVSSIGNPDLDPETSTNYNVGLLLQGDAWNASVDYWRFEIEDMLTNEPLQGILGAVFPNASDNEGNCASVDQAYLDRYFDFTDGECGISNILRVKTYAINGAGFTNDGIDVTGDYTWYNVGEGSLTAGAAATWINEYKTDDLVINGAVMESGFDGAGSFNLQTTLSPLPELRGSVYLNYALLSTNVRWTAQYIDSYKDQRTGIFAISDAGREISSWVVHNLTLRHDITDNMTLTASVDNVTDNDPPFARTEINYDAVTHTPMGRTFKVGAKVNF